MSKKRVLLVDDESAFTTVVKINLEGTGEYEVEVENVSSNAVAKAIAFRPDIILLDIVMPGVDGGDLKRKLAETPGLKNVPVIFVTALVRGGDTSAGAVVQTPDGPMLAKPVKNEVLVQAIEGCLAARL